MKRSAYVLLLMATLLVVFSSLASAQESRAAILGRVTDPSGSVVVGATIVVTNVGTNVSTRVSTNEAGLYEAPFLLPGEYQITAELTGFKKYERRGITLSVNSRVSIDVQMEVGGVSETISVTAQSPLLETTSASSGVVVENRRVMELPLGYNNPMQMSSLAPGMQRRDFLWNAQHTTRGLDYQVTGGVGGNEWSIDGTPNTSKGRGLAHLPYADAIEEFRVSSTTFDASEGHATGAFVSMQSKAGTNRAHGALTEQHWQQRWNATPTNTNAAYWGKIRAAEAAGNTALAQQLRSEPKQPSGRSNNWAGSFGGPVFLPKLYDGRNKLFFFFVVNGYNDRRSDPDWQLSTVPTADERAGDFSRLLKFNATRYQLYDPLTTTFNSSTQQYSRLPIAGNRIPTSRFNNPMYDFYQKVFPLPNNPPQMDAEGRNNYFNGSLPFNWDYWSMQNRVDYVPTDKDRFFARWSYNHFLQYSDDWTFTTMPGLHTRDLTRITKMVNTDYVRTFSATTILNIGAAYNRHQGEDMVLGGRKYKPSDVGLPAYLDQKAGDLHTLPRVEVSSYRSVSNPVRMLNPYSLGTLKAEVSKYIGRHGLKFGWNGRMYIRAESVPGYTSGIFGFTNNLMRQTSSTTTAGDLGLSWASFILGIPNSMSADTSDSLYATTRYQALFAQDNFRVNSKLTLNLGVRMEATGGIKERFNRGLADFDPAAEVPIAAAAQAAYAARPLAERAASDFIVRGGPVYLGTSGRNTLTQGVVKLLPRLGFAFAMNPKTVIRGGYGVYYDVLDSHRQGIDQQGYSRATSTTITTDQGVSYLVGDPARGISPLVDPFPVRADGTRFNTPFGNTLGSSSYLGSGFSFLPYGYEPAKSQRWRLEIGRQLTANTMFTVGYTGSWVGNLSVSQNLRPLPERYWANGLIRNDAVASDMTRNVPNPFALSGMAGLATSNPVLYQRLSTLSFFTSSTIQKQQLLRTYPHMTGLTNAANPIGKNKSNALEFRFEKRISRGFTLETHYEWSHTMTKDWFINEYDETPAWRESDDSRPHRWVVTSLYELPFGKGKTLLNRRGILNTMFGAWQVGGIWQMQSGECIDFGNLFYYGNDYRAIALPADQRTKDHWLNPAGFETNASKAPSSYHRRVFPTRLNWVRTQRLAMLDANLQKTFFIRESFRAVFRLDLLNAGNRQVLGNPATNPTAANFGQITGIINNPRYIQFQLRLAF